MPHFVQNNSASASNAAPVEYCNQLITEALDFHRAGGLEKAKDLYLRVLRLDPTAADAWHLLGMTLFAGQQNQEAVNCLQHALKFSPRHPEYLSNLGLIHRSMGELEAAKQVLEQAVEIRGESADFRNNLGTVYLELDCITDAERQFQTALKLQPRMKTAAMNLANLWLKRGQAQDAELAYRNLLADHPDDLLLKSNLAEALAKQGQWQAAVDILWKVVDRTDNPDIRLNLGRNLFNLGESESAKVQYEKLIELHPGYAKAYHYLGQLKFFAGDMLGSLTHLQTAIQLDENDAYTLGSLGNTLLEMGEVDQAEDCFRKALLKNPELSETHSYLLFLLSGDATIDQKKLFDEHQIWGQRHGNVEPVTDGKKNVVADRRLKIGYVSPNFEKHAVASYVVPVLENHDRRKFEIFCYAEVRIADEMTTRIQELADHWIVTTGLSDAQVAQRIAADDIDILVDLAGHTAGNRLRAMAYRPAPIQLTWIGYPNTTGLTAIDYRLTCAIQNPVDEPSWHTESLIRMPHGSFCFRQPESAPPLTELPAINSGVITFGSLHRPFKISQATLDVWAGVLLAVEESNLVLLNNRFTAESGEAVLSELEKRGIDRKRVDIRQNLPDGHYLTTYDEIDIALDVTPWAGGTTTLEALWMGVPVIAFYGDRRSARSTAAIVNGIGHPELIAYSPQQYVDIALSMANNLEGLQQLRRLLRDETRLSIANAARFTEDLEQEYRKIWGDFCFAQTKE